jgi:hypothetical protein
VPFSVAWTTFLRLFLEKGIGTSAQPYKLQKVNQNLSPRGASAPWRRCAPGAFRGDMRF